MSLLSERFDHLHAVSVFIVDFFGLLFEFFETTLLRRSDVGKLSYNMLDQE